MSPSPAIRLRRSLLSNAVRLPLLPVALLAAFSLPLQAQQVTAATPGNTKAKPPAQATDFQEIEVRSAGERTQAPAASALDIMQPQTTISLEWISNHTPPTADYAAIANVAPAVTSISLAGPGLGEAKQMTLRGFNDNQYNVTYDGIPFGDTNDFSHHTSSYFPAKMIGEVTVDRGPGDASQIGYATFGGTVALRSKDGRDDFSVIPTQTFGSYDTRLSHVELNTGRFDGPDSGKLIASAQYNRTDTFRTNTPMNRRTGYFKYTQPLGTSTELTFLSNYNSIRFNNPDKTSMTQAQIDTLGRNFGLNQNPASTDYVGYNYQTKQTDLEYFGITSRLSESWHLDNKLYTYAYNNDSHESPHIGTNASKTNMGGNYKVNEYRAWGDVLAVSHVDANGELKFGAWREYTHNNRSTILLDYTLGDGMFDYNPKKPQLNGFTNAYKYLMEDMLDTTQLYAQYGWKPTSALTVTPGIKYLSVTRTLDAPINQTTMLPLYYRQTWHKPLGSLSANYLINPDLSVYAQVAQGFLVPNLNQFYVPDPSHNRTRPQQTMNYQVGTVYKGEHISADADLFYIDYDNYPISAVDPVTKDPVFALAKGATMRGGEVEGAFTMDHGLQLFANASLIDAHFKLSGLRLPNVPSSTAAFGISYDQAGFTASLYDKYSGGQRAYNSGFNPDVAASVTSTSSTPGYWRAALSLGYGQKFSDSWFKSFKLRLQVDNLFAAKQQVVDSVKGTTPYYLVLPGRSWFASASFAL